MNICDANTEHVSGITAIYNDAVENSTAIWNETPVSVQDRLLWLEEKKQRGDPVIVAIDDSGTVLGFGSYGQFRPWEGYRYSVEHSVYVRADQRGRGCGQLLLKALIRIARSSGKQIMIAGIEAKNNASIKLHHRLGFEERGTLERVGKKFGNWLDLTFMQLDLDR